MNFRTFLPSFVAVLLACGMLSVLWFGGKLEPSASTAAELSETAPAAGEALAEGGASSDLDRGKQVYKKANCVGCHKWHGGGGGGYGGAALSLRETILTEEQLVEVVACGRPGTGMPAFHRKAYKGYDCYGMTAAELGEDKPPKPAKRLSDADIARVSAYVIAKIKEKGDMTKAQCVDFWGEGARECKRFK